MEQSPFQDRLYRPDEVARILQISKRSVYRMLEKYPQIMVTRVSRIVRVYGTSLNEFLLNNVVDYYE